MKRPSLWLVASVALLVLTPFLVFPEIMGDAGPQHVQLWRNCLGVALLVIAAGGILASLVAIVFGRRTTESVTQHS